MKEGWKEEPLGKYFEFEPKSKRKAGEGKDEGEYKFFTSSDIQKKFVDEADFEGEHLIFGTGGGASIHYCDEKFSTSTDCFIVKVKPEIKTKYVYYFIRAHIHLLEAGFKGAGLKHVSKDHLREMMIKFPEDTKVQDKIIALLEKAEQIKDWRKEADQLSKDYLKSVFVDMFGDGNEIEKLGKMCSKVSSGSTPKGGSQNYQNDGEILFIRSQNVLMNKFSNHDKLYISKEIHEKMKRTWVKKNDVLLNITGASIGRTTIYLGENDKANVNQHVCIIRVSDPKKLNPQYLSYCLSGDKIQNDIKRINAGGTREALNYTQIKDFDIPVPDIKKQEKFSIIVEKFSEIQEFQRKQRNNSENLFNSLMQKAFKGELL